MQAILLIDIEVLWCKIRPFGIECLWNLYTPILSRPESGEHFDFQVRSGFGFRLSI